MTFYLAYVCKSTTSDSMIITLHWTGGIPSIYIFVSKDTVVVSKNPLINELSLKIGYIPNNAKGKQLYFWIIIQNDIIKIDYIKHYQPIAVTHPNLQNKDENFSIIYVSDSPFTIRRGLITKVSMILVVMLMEISKNLKEVKEQSFKKIFNDIIYNVIQRTNYFRQCKLCL